MADRPIIFSAPMVRALLEGRKTQARRVLKPQPEACSPSLWPGCCRPSYTRGDRLWVREAFSRDGQSDGDCLYRATVDDDTGYYAEEIAEIRWSPSIHMPRWASRLTLIVTDVRVQRLQEITLGDICAEGLAKSIYDFAPVQRGFDAWAALWNNLHGPKPRRRAGGTLPPRSAPDFTWDANPWVAAISFRVIRANIDSPEAANA